MDRLREILGSDYELSEEELERLRREMHELAEIIVEAALVRLGGIVSEIDEPSRSEEDVEAD